MAGEIKTLVTAEEALKVAKQIHGPDVELLDYEVEKGTATVQGFLSNILRVIIRVKDGEEFRSSKFVVKRLPVLDAQQKMAEEFGVFEHEINVLEKCLPILWERCPDLPAVRCYLTDAKNRVIYMEDLKESGYCALVRNISDLKETVLEMVHLKMAMQTLAKFHAASIGINWLERFPEIFTEDIFFEKTDGAVMKNCITQAVNNILLPITKHYFKADEKYVNAVEWVGSDGYFQTLTKICKHDPNGDLNVMCHGDSWANNMMFKIDPESGKPEAIKLIDFQISRYAPANRDLMYFIYMVCTYGFRKENEKELLLTYWEAFNKECEKVDIEIKETWDEFYADYDGIRAFGLMMAATMRPVVFIEGALPEGEDELTEEQVNKMMEGGGTDSEKMIEDFEKNPVFRHEMINVIEEVAQVYCKLHRNN